MQVIAKSPINQSAAENMSWERRIKKLICPVATGLTEKLEKLITGNQEGIRINMVGAGSIRLYVSNV